LFDGHDWLPLPVRPHDPSSSHHSGVDAVEERMMIVYRNVLITLFIAGLALAVWDILDGDGWQGVPDGVSIMGISALLFVAVFASKRGPR
jgi:hypothetical protein